MLLDLAHGSVLHAKLDLEHQEGRDRSRLMVTLDALNARYGKGAVQLACTGMVNQTRTREMTKERRTPPIRNTLLSPQ